MADLLALRQKRSESVAVRFMRSLPKLALAPDFVQNLETLSFGS
jgi:hypothetical protein